MAKKKRRTTSERALAQQIQDMQLMQKIEKLMIRGVNTKYEIAAMYNVNVQQVDRLMKQVYELWKLQRQQDPELAEQKDLRCRQYEMLYRESLDSFERSKIRQVGTETKPKECETCDGLGKLEDLPNQFRKCQMCDGSGVVEEEEPVYVQVPGDPAFLRLAKDVLNEMTKFEGTAPVAASARSMLITAQQVGGQVQTRVEELYTEAPVETLLRAKSVLDDLNRANEQRQAAEKSKVSIIAK